MRNEEVGQVLVPATKVEPGHACVRGPAGSQRSGMLDLIVVGYLQLMGAEHLTGNRATAVAFLARA